MNEREKEKEKKQKKVNKKKLIKIKKLELSVFFPFSPYLADVMNERHHHW